MKILTGFVALAVASAAAAAPRADPIHVQKTVIVYGAQLVLAGTFSHGQKGVPVVVSSRAYGDPDYAPIALLTTKSGGRWSTPVQPTIHTAYRATSLAEKLAVSIDVRPRVTLGHRSGGFVARVVSSASYERHFVLLQRRTAHGWKKVAKIVLRRRPKRFEIALPRGRSRVRAFLPQSQAGRGYVASASAPVAVTR